MIAMDLVKKQPISTQAMWEEWVQTCVWPVTALQSNQIARDNRGSPWRGAQTTSIALLVILSTDKEGKPAKGGYAN